MTHLPQAKQAQGCVSAQKEGSSYLLGMVVDGTSPVPANTSSNVQLRLGSKPLTQAVFAMLILRATLNTKAHLPASTMCYRMLQVNTRPSTYIAV